MADVDSSYALTRQNYDEGADWHSEKSASYDWTDQIERFSQALRGTKVLDAGCGSGRDIQKFIDKGLEVEGLDFSGETIKRCRTKFKKALFHEGDLRDMELDNTSFDGVWACASILNLKKADVSAALAEMKRVLKPGGVVFISVKEGEGERIISDKAGQRFFSFFSLPEIKEIVERAGFTVFHEEIVPDSQLVQQQVDDSKPAWICLYATADS